MGNVLIKEETMTAIAEAIREKQGSEELYKPAEMPEEIRSIKTGGFAEPVGRANRFDPIRFYGAYGELLYSYTLEEFAEVTELPALPEYDGLLPQEWNWTLEKIKAVNGEVEIGSLHITDDGSTRIYFRLVEGALSPRVGFVQNRAKAVWIDWGDGSELETSDTYGDEAIVSMGHHYAEVGEYVIRLVPEEDAIFTFVGNTYSGLVLHEDISLSSGLNLGYLNTVSKIELGTNITELGKNSFGDSSVEYVIMPKHITDIKSAFNSAKGLKYFVFPRGVTTTSDYVFYSCKSLQKVVFSETKCSINSGAFRYCSALLEFIMASNSAFYGTYTFADCTGLKRAVLPTGVTSRGGDMFVNDIALCDVVVRSELKQVSNRVFSGCESMKYFELPDNVYSLGGSVFSKCYSLQHFRIPKNVSTISSSVFDSCYSLKEIVIHEEISKIEAKAFSGCNSMKNYYLHRTTPPTLANTNALTVGEGCKIHVPKGCLEAYQTATNWSAYADYMVEMEE